jgi:hypothetical protein
MIQYYLRLFHNLSARAWRGKGIFISVRNIIDSILLLRNKLYFVIDMISHSGRRQAREDKENILGTSFAVCHRGKNLDQNMKCSPKLTTVIIHANVQYSCSLNSDKHPNTTIDKTVLFHSPNYATRLPLLDHNKLLTKPWIQRHSSKPPSLHRSSPFSLLFSSPVPLDFFFFFFIY